jgi:phage-related baseplate assembly protein
VLEVCAYRELLIRQRVNDAARAVMVAYASGADLDQLAANYGISRLLITPADDTTIPPTPAVYEDDAALRSRVTLSLEGYTSAGSQGSYVFHALSASGEVKDVSAISPDPGQVAVYVLSQTGNGAASVDLIAAVEAALNAEKVRPMTDQVTVLSASIVNYTIEAELVVYPGPDSDVVLEAAQAAAAAYAEAQHRMGYDVTLSGIYAALHQPGVQRVNLTAPAANLVVDDGEAAYCTAITLTVAPGADV